MPHMTVLDLNSHSTDMKTIGVVLNRNSNHALRRLHSCLSDHFDYPVEWTEQPDIDSLDGQNFVEFEVKINEEDFSVTIRLEPAFTY